MEGVFVKGMTVGELSKHLETLQQDKPIRVACDEELNSIYVGFMVQTYKDEVVIAPLSGTDDRFTLNRNLKRF